MSDLRNEFLDIPSVSKGIFKVCQRNFLSFRQNWMADFLGSTAEPLIILLVLGLGLGVLIPEVKGESYFEFLFPGLICFVAFNISFVDCSYGILRRRKTSGAYSSFILSPLKKEDIALGEIVWTSIKSLFTISFIFLVYLIVTKKSPVEVLPIYGLMFILVWIGATLGALSTSFSSQSRMLLIINSLYVYGISSINNVFFPGELLKPWVYWLSMISPVPHAVALARSPFNFFENSQLILHVAALFVFFVLFTNVAVFRFRTK